MTQEEKQLLTKELCARLPYGVYVDIYSWQRDSPKLLVECVPEYIGEEVVLKKLAGRHSIKEVKPYLRPMSSMTEEEIDYVERHFHYTGYNDWDYVDWLNQHHFDHRGLIEMGLALEAPEGMYEIG